MDDERYEPYIAIARTRAGKSQWPPGSSFLDKAIVKQFYLRLEQRERERQIEMQQLCKCGHDAGEHSFHGFHGPDECHGDNSSCECRLFEETISATTGNDEDGPRRKAEGDDSAARLRVLRWNEM